jgi:ribosomal protein S18 acetylase RimI-like enzyme
LGTANLFNLALAYQFRYPGATLETIILTPVIANREVWMSLLLEADESEPVVRSYLNEGELFTIDEGEEHRGVVLVIGEGDDLEFKNIAVEQMSRGRGLGVAAITLVIDEARSRGFRRVIVGTADSSVGTIGFYERRGFRIYGVRRGFFDAYPKTIVEDGIAAHDMVMLEIAVQPKKDYR